MKQYSFALAAVLAPGSTHADAAGLLTEINL
jgi:hypothetical protein